MMKYLVAASLACALAAPSLAQTDGRAGGALDATAGSAQTTVDGTATVEVPRSGPPADAENGKLPAPETWSDTESGVDATVGNDIVDSSAGAAVEEHDSTTAGDESGSEEDVRTSGKLETTTDGG